MSEAVSQKSGWTTVAFGDVVKKVTDKVDPEESGLERYVAGEHMDTDDLRIRRWGEIGDDYLGPAFHMRFKPGQVLYGSRRTYLRKVAVPDFEGITANTTYVLESKAPEILLPELLPFLMQAQTFHEHSKRESKGSVNPYVNFSDLAWYKFALPPLDEQRRIAKVLQACAATRECHQNVILKVDSAMRSLRDSAFGIHSDSISLGSLCDDGKGIQIGPFGSQLHQSDYVESGVAVVMPTEIENDRICDNEIARVTEDKADSLSKHRLRPSDIVLPRRGDFDRRAIVTERETGWLCGTGCLRIRLQDSTLASTVMQSLASPSVLRWIDSRSVGTVMPNLNLQIVGNIPVRIPKPSLALGAVTALERMQKQRDSVMDRIDSIAQVSNVLLGGLK